MYHSKVIASQRIENSTGRIQAIQCRCDNNFHSGCATEGSNSSLETSHYGLWNEPNVKGLVHTIQKLKEITYLVVGEQFWVLSATDIE